jgi:hypothetical protein
MHACRKDTTFWTSADRAPDTITQAKSSPGSGPSSITCERAASPSANSCIPT